MSNRPRFVFDTNVLVDALCFKTSFGRRAFDAVRRRGELAYSMATLAELVEVVYRPRLQRYIGEEERRRFLVLFQQQAVLVEPKVEIRACRDPKDDNSWSLLCRPRPKPSSPETTTFLTSARFGVSASTSHRHS
jgi:putative PIN family toxin of toxin-antitoxin system